LTSAGAPGSEGRATGVPDDDRSVEVVVPTELAIDPLSRHRLIERLATSPAEVTAVAAPLEPLAAGSSTVVQAEWAAVDATGDPRGPEPSPEREIAAAVAVRAGVGHVVGRRSVTVQEGTILVDPGTRTSDPFADAPIEAAGPRARPPFRRRPVVLFLEGSEPLAPPEALRDLVNGLVVHEVEARLATDRPVPGPHATRICSPTEPSWRALQPDIAVLGDPLGFERASDWCDQRGTVFIALDPALGSTIELVSWTIGQARGRLRARIGPGADPAELARLVNRLCAGPQPEPPVDRPGSPVVEPRRRPGPTSPADASLDRELDDDDLDEAEAELDTRAGPRTVRRVAVTARARAAPSAAARLDQLEAAGHQIVTVDLREASSSGDGSGADVLIVDPGTDPAALVAWRARAGRDTQAVLDLTTAVVGPSSSMAAPADVAEGAVMALAGATGAVLVDRADQVMVWRARGVRAQLAPALLTREMADGLGAAAARRFDPPAPLLGWQLDPVAGSGHGGHDGRVEGQVREAIAAALVQLLADQPDARVEIVGMSSAPGLEDHPQVLIRSDPPDAGQLAAWTAHLWSAGVPAAPARPGVFEAALAGVPTITAARAEGTDGELVITSPLDPAAWLATVEAVNDDQARRRWSARARARAEALRGPEASRLATERFLGWATAAGARQ
jgi:hypothetical protein